MNASTESTDKDMEILCNACLEVISNALGTTWKELKALLQEEERLEKLRKEECVAQSRHSPRSCTVAVEVPPKQTIAKHSDAATDNELGCRRASAHK